MIIFFLSVFLLNLIFLVKFDYISTLLNLIDKPSKIKIHKNKIPCFGGIIFLFNISLFIIFLFFVNNNPELSKKYSIFLNEDFYASLRAGISLFLITIFLFLLGFLDDRLKISANKKLFFQLFFCMVAVLVDENLIIKSLKFSNGYEIELYNLSIIFTILCFLIFINALNMFDGINNQVSLYIFILSAYVLFKINNLYFIYVLIIANFYFFYFNYQNRLFLGDNGSLIIGYLFANLLTKSHNLDKGIFADEIVVLMFFPVMDLLRLFIRRVLLNRHPFSGDLNHLHHRLKKRYGCKMTNFLIPTSIISSLIMFQLNAFFGLSIIFISYFTLIIKSK